MPQFGGLGGIQTLTRSLQDFYAVGYITSPDKNQFRVPSLEFRVAAEGATVFPNSKPETPNSKLILVAVGGVEPPTSRL